MPHGQTYHGGKGDVGAWSEIPLRNNEAWQRLKPRYEAILEKHPKLHRGNHANHLGTLGTGHHFIEVCRDEAEMVWFLLHSGSRGVGNRTGSYFIEQARKDMEKFFIPLPDLVYFSEGTVDGGGGFDGPKSNDVRRRDFRKGWTGVLLTLAERKNCSSGARRKGVAEAQRPLAGKPARTL